MVKSIKDLKVDFQLYLEGLDEMPADPYEIIDDWVKSVFEPRRSTHMDNITRNIQTLVKRKLSRKEFKPIMDEIVLFMRAVTEEIRAVDAVNAGFERRMEQFSA